MAPQRSKRNLLCRRRTPRQRSATRARRSARCARARGVVQRSGARGGTRDALRRSVRVAAPAPAALPVPPRTWGASSEQRNAVGAATARRPPPARCTPRALLAFRGPSYNNYAAHGAALSRAARTAARCAARRGRCAARGGALRRGCCAALVTAAACVARAVRWQAPQKGRPAQQGVRLLQPPLQLVRSRTLERAAAVRTAGGSCQGSRGAAQAQEVGSLLGRGEVLLRGVSRQRQKRRAQADRRNR